MVPEGWELTDLGSLGKWSGGGTPSKSNQLFWEKGNIPWVSPKDMHVQFVEKTVDYITEDAVKNSSTKLYPENTVMVVTRSGILRKRLPVALSRKEMAVNQDIKAFPPHHNVCNYFLACFMWCYNETLLAKCAKEGTTVESIDTDSLMSFPIKLPKLNEQKKIAQILGTWDKAIIATEKLLKNSQQQKKALMQQLLTGKKRLLDDNGVTFSSAWKIGHLNDFVRKIYGGGTPQRSNPDYWGGSIPWITVKDLVKTHIDGAQESINEKGLNESAANLVRKGTIIIATRMAVGKTVVASCDVAINQDLKAIIPTDDLCSEYLFNWFIFNSSKIEKMGTGSTVKGVQVESIRKLKIKIPGSIKEQRSIIKVLDNIEQVTLFYKQKISCLKQEKKALMQQLLTGKRRVKVGIKEVA